MTSPWEADSADLIATDHGQVWSVVVTHPDLDAPVPLTVEDISVTRDARRTPRVSASITASLADGLPEALDPRTGARVDIQAGYIRPGGEQDLHALADLGVRSITVDHDAGTVRVTAEGDEALIIDASPAVAGTISAATHSGAVQLLMNAALSPRRALAVDASVVGGAVALDPVPDRWSAIQDVADRVDAAVYDDGLRSWHMVPKAGLSSSPVHTLTVGEAGTVLRAEPSLDRDEWHNYVMLRYRWRDATDVDRQVIATAYISAGAHRIDGPAGRRILLEDRDVQTTQADANAAAKSVLRREQSRSRTFRLSAIAAFWVDAWDTVRVTLPGGSAESHLVVAVTFNSDGTMDLETRIPDPLTSVTVDGAVAAPVETTTPPAAPVEPDPEPPAVQSYVSTWTASAARTFKGDGSQNTFGDAGSGVDVLQGYYSGSNGNQRGVILFGAANSTGSESGVSITSALTGATISKVEVWLYANHWYSAAGGTARIGYYDGASLPASFSGGSPYVSVSGWARNSGRWVNVTSSAFIRDLLDGSARGVTVGPGATTSHTYYGAFNGSGASTNKPLLRITYAK